MSRWLGVFLLTAWFPGVSWAIRADPASRQDIKRFGLDNAQAPTVEDSIRRAREEEALRRFNAQGGGRRFARGLRALSADGGAQASPPDARRAAEAFLRSSRSLLGIDPAELRLELARTDGGVHHLMFEQIHEGVPVERAKVKVHIDEGGEVRQVRSGYVSVAGLSPIPSVPESAAAAAAAADLGALAPRSGGTLVFLPLRGVLPRLAWKFRLAAPGGRWVIFVDAAEGSVLFRYNDLRLQGCPACAGSAGKVMGDVFDLDPVSTIGPVPRPFTHQRVHIWKAPPAASAEALTGASGCYCSGDQGKVFASLQGPYVHVANFNVSNAHYDNGGGAWSTFASPISSPHPYADNAVSISTINAPSGALKLMPVFSSFDVGAVDFYGEISDDDQVSILDGSGNAVATYVGNRTASFQGAAVAGPKLNLKLASNASGSHSGFDVTSSRYLTLSASPSSPDAATSNFTWTSTMTLDGTIDEVNLFYHLNKMHDYFMGGPNSSTSAYISKPVVAMARAGPNLAQAFYDPVAQNLSFGTVGEGYARDATVIRHEYTHYVIDQVYPVLNYGQHGAISEALADYFAAASFSFNDPVGADVTAIGKYTNSGLGYEGALREIDTTKASTRIFPTHWTGEIHDDSLFVSQALYELRRDLVGSLGASAGRRCADRLVYRSLFYFPDNFTDLLAAILQVSANSALQAPDCGANGSQDGLVRARFSGHGIVERAAPSAGQDAYEPNDGAQSATDVTTAAAISGNIYPAADQDYFAAGAGAGRFRAVLSLPEHSEAPGTHYAYGLTLLDGKFNILKTADPLIDVNPSLNGGCPNLPATPCLTTHGQVVLEYDNPSAGQLYLVVAAGITDNGSNDRTSSTRMYALSVESSPSGALATTIAASYDRDVIGFSVAAASFSTAQNFVFHRARLRDHALVPLPDTATDGATSYLRVQGSTSSGGLVSGTLKLADLSPSLPGFAARFPSVGTVYLEIFGRNPLGRSQSLGFSNALHLGGRSAELSAWNNIFNPLRGEKATAKYEILEPGQVKLRLFTVNGSLVRTLVDEAKPAGKGSVDWDGTNSAGSRVASGIYLLHLEAPGITKTQKIIVIK